MSQQQNETSLVTARRGDVIIDDAFNRYYVLYFFFKTSRLDILQIFLNKFSSSIYWMCSGYFFKAPRSFWRSLEFSRILFCFTWGQSALYVISVAHLKFALLAKGHIGYLISYTPIQKIKNSANTQNRFFNLVLMGNIVQYSLVQCH